MNLQRTLVSAQQLLDHPEWRIFDCRHELSDPARGEREYAAGHLPGALHVHLDRDLSSRPDGHNGRHPLPRPEHFIAWMGRVGLRPSDQVVAYDDAGGMYAARLWWLLRAAGHDAVAVLDGGYTAWCASGGPLTTDVPQPRPLAYPGRWQVSGYVDASMVEANLTQRALTLVDARGANRFAGQDETIDPVAGHIPGALNRPFLQNL
jgi:thiosulfate/3-mercaptopyruvate sulfurtransferase